MPRVVQKKTSGSSTAPNRLRIIGGRWRGMRIDFPPVAAIRPSPDRVRETLFNWLQQRIVRAHCLDLFAGSGALGIEALSRGAENVTFVEREPIVARHLQSTLQRLGSVNAEVVATDALRYLQRSPKAFDIVFLDPPFSSDLLVEIYGALSAGWLKPSAYVYVECPAEVSLTSLPAGWSVHRSKRAGQVGYHLLRTAASAAEEAS